MSLIFVSCRRSDAPGHAGRIYDRLVERFGETNVFKDLDSMEPGADFSEVIAATIARCDAVIAVIGREWLGTGPDGRRRVDDPEDWVRLELSNALKRKVRVVPVLVEDAQMPAASELPQDLTALARRHGVELRESAWNAQVAQLLASLEQALASLPPGSARRPRGEHGSKQQVDGAPEPGRQQKASRVAQPPATKATPLAHVRRSRALGMGSSFEQRATPDSSS